MALIRTGAKEDGRRKRARGESPESDERNESRPDDSGILGRQMERVASEVAALLGDDLPQADPIPEPGLAAAKARGSGIDVPAVLTPIADRLKGIGDLSDGSIEFEGVEADGTLLDSYDRLGPFSPAVLAVRWSTTALSVALASQEMANGAALTTFWATLLLVYTAFRTVRPIRYLGNVRSVAEVIAEAALSVLIVGSTGYWESPFVFALTTSVTVAGFARGFGFAFRIAAVSAVSVTVMHLVREEAELEDFLFSLRTSSVMLLIALVSGWARRVSGEADRQRALVLHRLDRLTDANALLENLHRVAQSLPASLDIDDVVDGTVARLRGFLDFEAVVVAASDSSDEGGWDVLHSEGCRLGPRIPADSLIPPAQRAVSTGQVVWVRDHSAEEELGFARRASTGIYAALPSRGEVMGFLAIERTADRPFTERDLQLVSGFSEPTGLAIDNARWFARLRTVGADEERTRIARDLHDRIGQSLAYLAIELDRIVSAHQNGKPIEEALDQLRTDVRGVVGEVRDTLYDLRTDVSDQNDLASTIEQYSSRVRERSKVDVDLLLERKHRLPLLQEREIWRICQEAITNIERHADAKAVRIEWRCDGTSASLEISDNGRGFPVGHAGRLDSYGILGMRERASSIGATLELQSKPGEGTTLKCVLVSPR